MSDDHRTRADAGAASTPPPFEGLPTVPSAEQLVDSAFSRAARSGRAKRGVDGQQSMLTVASNILSDNLAHVVRSWPTLEDLHPFYYELADILVDVDVLRQHLASVDWAAAQIESIAAEHRPRIQGDADRARRHRKQAFARMADVVDEVADDLEAIETARRTLAAIPGIDPAAPTIVIAGYPNVGKSTFLNAVTRANVTTDTYPFTTTGIQIGHVEYRHVAHQLIDTPGLLDRPETERNEVERQAATALEYLADAVLVFVDPSETCGYPLSDQLALRDEVRDRFARRDIPVLTVGSKSDLSTDVAADYLLSLETDEGVDALLTAALEAVDYRPSLPHEGP